MSNKLAVIASDFPAPGHPAYVFVEQLVNAMVDLGEQVTVIAPQSITRHYLRHVPLFPIKSTAKSLLGNEYEVYRPYYLSLGNCPSLVQKLLNVFRTRGIKKILESQDINVLYAHFWENAMPVYKYASKHNLPLFVACGEGDEALENLKESLTDSTRGELCKAVNGVISVSSENKRKCIDFNLIDSDKIEVFPNCVNTDLFKPSVNPNLKKKLGIEEDDFTISFVGGFIHRKGAKRVASAISKLGDPHIKSIFIGQPFANDSELPECEGIVFKGPLKHDDIPAYLNCSDVFVLPTLKEGCCNAIVEALSCGLPIISSDGVFNDDIIDSNNSIRIDPLDLDAIAIAIKKMKEDKSFYKNLQTNILKNRSKFSIIGRAQRIIGFVNSHKNNK